MVTNTQLSLAIGIPSLLVLVSMLVNYRATKDADAKLMTRMDALDRRLDRIEKDVMQLVGDLRTFLTTWAGMRAGWMRGSGRSPGPNGACDPRPPFRDGGLFCCGARGLSRGGCGVRGRDSWPCWRRQ
jgi:hypothetical protein